MALSLHKCVSELFFFFNDTATTEIYTLSLHDALPISQVPQRVIDRTTEYWRTMNANQGGAFTTSQRSDALIVQVREAAATFLNAASADEIVFGPNMTTLTFAFSRAIGRELQPGDEIVVTRLDHDGNVSPWLALEERGVTVRFVEIKVPECTIDMADLQRQLTA